MLTNDELMDILRANKGGTMLDFAHAVDAAAVRRASERGPICGENTGPMDADLAGCGKPIEAQDQVYRCTHCAVPFHRDCAERHFADTPELSSQAMEEQIRRIDAREARVGPSESVQAALRRIRNCGDEFAAYKMLLELLDRAACEAVADARPSNEKAPVSAISVSAEALQVLTELVRLENMDSTIAYHYEMSGSATPREQAHHEAEHDRLVAARNIAFPAAWDRARSLVGALQGVKE